MTEGWPGPRDARSGRPEPSRSSTPAKLCGGRWPWRGADRIADGISYSPYVKLEKILGPKYSGRIVSAENVITDFRARRILREVSTMINALEAHRQILERSLSREVITPGVTTLREIGWWVREEHHKRGLGRRHNTGVGIPHILYSVKSEPIDPPSTGGWIYHPDYVIQRGDFLNFDNGVRYLDYFSTDYTQSTNRTVEAPAVFVYRDYVYFTGIDAGLFRSRDPLGPFEYYGDFKDEDGKSLKDDRVYFYFAGRSVNGISGAELDSRDVRNFFCPAKRFFQFEPSHIWEQYGNRQPE